MTHDFELSTYDRDVTGAADARTGQGGEHNRILSLAGVVTLAAVMVVGMALSSAAGVAELDDFISGQRGYAAWITVLCLAWQIVAIGACVAVISTLMRMRLTLYGRQQFLSAMAQTSAAEWMWETDLAGSLTYCSAGVRGLLGYEPTALLGHPAVTWLAPTARLTGAELTRLAQNKGSGWNDVDLDWTDAAGQIVTLRGSAAPLADHHGRVTGFRGSRRRLTAAETGQAKLVPTQLRVTALLRQGRIATALQPIVDLNSGRLVGAEALARFSDGRSPGVWFDEAEQTGQGLELDAMAFRAALTTLECVPADSYLSVNATPELILSGLVRQTLLASALPLERILLEITEHSRVANYDGLREELAPLRSRGMRIAVDDTGAGYSSLSHVLHLRPSIIKIDRSLITNVSTDPARRSLVTALVLLALDLGAAVVGEGIETQQERDTLTTLGVGYGQGFLLARPSTDMADWQRWGSHQWPAPAYA